MKDKKDDIKRIKAPVKKRNIFSTLILLLSLLLGKPQSANSNFDSQIRIRHGKVINDQDVNSFEDNDGQVILVKGHWFAEGFSSTTNIRPNNCSQPPASTPSTPSRWSRRSGLSGSIGLSGSSKPVYTNNFRTPPKVVNRNVNGQPGGRGGSDQPGSGMDQLDHSQRRSDPKKKNQQSKTDDFDSKKKKKKKEDENKEKTEEKTEDKNEKKKIKRRSSHLDRIVNIGRLKLIIERFQIEKKNGQARN